VTTAVAAARRGVAVAPAWIWLTGIVVVSALVRWSLAREQPAPWIFDDELLYWRLSVNFAHAHHFLVREASGLSGVGPGYPLLIAPASALFGDVPRAYFAAQGINALLMSLGAVPAYLLGRRLVGQWLALAGAVFAVVLPSFLFTGTIMTENAFYPAFLCCALAFVWMLEAPTLLRQVVAFAVVVPAFLIRAQGAVLFAALVTATLGFVLAEAHAAGELRSRRRLLERLDAFRLMWIVLGIGAILLVVAQVARGRPVTGVLGAYEGLTSSSYTVTGVAKWFVYHLAELDLYMGFLPFAALIVVAVLALGRGETSRAVRAFAAVTLSLVVWITLVTAAFATQIAKTNGGVGRIEERNDFYLVPLFLLAFLLWVDRGLPRPARLAAAAAATAAALPGVLPLIDLANLGALSDTFAFIPLARAVIRGSLTPSELSVVVACAALIGALVFVLLPRRLALVAPALVLVYLVAWQIPVQRQMHETSTGLLAQALGVPRGWVDDKVGGGSDVVEVWTGNTNPLALTQTEFFNRSVEQVYTFGGGPLGQGLPEQPLSLNEATGNVLDQNGLPLQAEYLLTDGSLVPLGRRIATDPLSGLVLSRTSQPVRISSRITGRFGDGWTGPQMNYTRFGCKGGRLLLTLTRYQGLVPGPQTVRITSGRHRAQVFKLRDAKPHQVSIPLGPPPGRCDMALQVSPTGIPQQVFGTPDARELGVRVEGFQVVPA
jgi:hypothetical protein